MKRVYFLFFIALFLLSAATGLSQPYFQRYDSIPVKISGAYMTNPWAGGLNFVQLSTIDLNQDGIKDLFVFDRTGNKIRTFIDKGAVGAVDYKYAPEYESKFPILHDWALLADYNCDGKEDIFTYSSGGFAIYKNISDNTNGLQFSLVTPLQYSIYNPPNGILINLYVSSVDVPAITDIDNDGDLDIVTFSIGGTYLEYHQNQSMELYGTCDSLKFQMKNSCWGYTSENQFNFNYLLNDTCQGNVVNPGLVENNINSEDRSAERHSGSCILCMDLDGDLDKELITGDISFSYMSMLTNGGTPTASHMVAVDPAFPSNNPNTVAVDLAIFPCGYHLDIDNDGLKDLVVSPNAPNASENFNSLVYYKNTGTNSFPAFEYKQSNLLQDSMIEVGEGAYPAFFDYNNDGLKDLFIGNYGYYASTGFRHQIAQFKNTGTVTAPQFELVTRDYLGLSSLGLTNMIPTFGDMDADGDSDMIIGGYDGKLQYFQNIAAPGDTAQLVLLQSNLRDSANAVIDVGDFAAPQIVDMDNDGKNDLVIGKRNGKITYYQHIGSASSTVPVLNYITNSFGGVSVSAPGYVTGYTYPFVFKQGGVTKLLVGTEKGYLSLYDNIDGNLNGAFTLLDSTYLNIYEGTRTSPTGTDLNNDGYMDLIIGNYQGGVAFYKGVPNMVTSAFTESPLALQWGVDLYPNPANTTVTVKIINNDISIYSLEIYTILGQSIISEKISSNEFLLNTEGFNPGVYICKLTELNGNGTKKSRAIVKRIVIRH
jgi:hypothetical protein